MNRSPGRPPLDDDNESVKVCVTVSSKTYKDLCDQARRERLTGVPELIRRELGVQPNNKNI